MELVLDQVPSECLLYEPERVLLQSSLFSDKNGDALHQYNTVLGSLLLVD